MRLAAPLAASIAVHAALVAVLVLVERPRPRAARAATPAPEVTLVAPPDDAVPIDVVIVPTPVPSPSAPAVAMATPAPPAPAPIPLHRTASVSVPAAVSASVPESASTSVPASDPTAGHGALSMRLPGGNRAAGPGVAPATVSSALERIAAAGKPPPPDPTTGELHRTPGGGAVKRESVFTAEVERDGTVHITDKPNVQWEFKLRPRKVGRALAKHLDDWTQNPYGVASGTSLVQKHPTPSDENDQDDTVIIPILGAKFDVNDALERLAGNDPYAARKLALLDRTRDERIQMGTVERARQLGLTEQTVRRELASLWARRDLTVAARKEALFELWDDCAETGDAGIVEAGGRARRQVVGFIRAHLPAGGALAYSVDELAAFNRRRTSKAPFAPYDARPSTSP